jgi:transcriptional regulator with XRE-family HTH domain
MNNDFPRILALLRKERKLSQKQAATDLGIMQALLSHYEKGKRECGLDFLVRAADYYCVSTDYLLGRTASSDGAVLEEGVLPDSDELDKAAGRSFKHMSATLAKKMLINGITLIYSLAEKADNQKLTASVTEFLTLSVYSCFRLVHRANPKNDANFFAVKEAMAFRGAAAQRNMCEARGVIAADDNAKRIDPDLPLITTAGLEADYGRQATALMSLVKNAEKAIKP